MSDNYETILNDPASLLSKAREFQAQYMHDLAILLAENVYKITNDFNWTKQADEIISISGYYSKLPEKKNSGKISCERIALNRELSWHERDIARKNSVWYADSLSQLCSSTILHKINFVTKPNYSATNPSITVTPDGKIMMIQRTVNYLIREDGSYDMQGDHAIRTINYLVEFDYDFNIINSQEILPPVNLPDPKYSLVIGWEDCRLFVWQNSLWCTSTVRELTDDGWCNIVLSRIEHTDINQVRFADYKIIEPNFKEKQHEKNWMPFVRNNALNFVYSCDPVRIIDYQGNLISQQDSSIASDSFRGGGNLVEFDGNWLAIIHESHIMHDNRRTYMHRFVLYNNEGKIIKYSPSFYFKHLGIEFAAGLARHPTTGQIIVSFGYKDNESYLAIVTPDEISSMLIDVPDVINHEAFYQHSNIFMSDNNEIENLIDNDISNIILELMNHQTSSGIIGNVMEIGEKHDRAFYLMAHGCSASEEAICVNVVNNQTRNDISVDETIIENNIKKFALVTRYKFIHTNYSHIVNNIIDQHRNVRFLSINNGYNQDNIYNNLCIAENILQSGGIVIVDSVYDTENFAVTNTIYNYLHNRYKTSNGLVPFAMFSNKLMFTTSKDFARKYQYNLLKNFQHLIGLDNNEWQEFFYSTRVLILKSN